MLAYHLNAISDPYEDLFDKKKVAKSEKVAKNELQRLRNIARAHNKKGNAMLHNFPFVGPGICQAGKAWSLQQSWAVL